MADPIHKEIKGWTITNYGGNFNVSVSNGDSSIDPPDADGSVYIEHEGCMGSWSGCATSSVFVPIEVLVEYLIAHGYEVKKAS